MRAGLAEAVHHARHRKVFGKTLIDQPLMQRVLADMALDVAGATALVVPAGALLRRGGQRPRRGGLCPRHDAGGEILGLQDRAGAALRGDGMPRRQRLCRGGAARALLSRGAGQRDLGRLRQCHGARRAARARACAGAVRRGARRHRARSRAGRSGHRRRAARRHAGRSLRRGVGAHPDRTTGAVGGGRRTEAAWGPGASPTPSSRRGSPASGAPPTACSTRATTRG